MRTLLSTSIKLIGFTALLSGAAFAYAQDKLPQKGETKAQVEASVGAPVSKKAAVGEPPISSWTYANFTVYFEGDRVVHTVNQ